MSAVALIRPTCVSGRSRGARGSLFTVLCAVAFLALAGPAQAADNYAGPTSVKDTGTCTDINDPCTVDHAAEVATTPGDFIYLLPGIHFHSLVGNIYMTVEAGVTLTTLPGSPRATIIQSGPYQDNGNRALVANFGTIDNVRIVQQNPASTYGAVTMSGSGTVTRSVLEGVERGAFVNVPGSGGTFRGNVVRATGSASAIALLVGPGGVLNVSQSTIWSTGYGLELSSGASDFTMTVHNSIVHGDNKDFWLYSEYDYGSHIVVDHTNARLDSFASSGGGSGGNRSLFDAGDNIAAPPTLASPASGDFHQLVGSNTINAGSAPFAGLDIDSEPFGLACAPDMGADEFTQAACGVPGAPAAKLLAGVRESVTTRRKHGKVSVKVTCPKAAVGACTGTVTVKQGKKTRTVKVKATRPGKSITLKIKAKKGRARITVTLTDSSGATGKKTTTKTLK